MSKKAKKQLEKIEESDDEIDEEVEDEVIEEDEILDDDEEVEEDEGDEEVEEEEVEEEGENEEDVQDEVEEEGEVDDEGEDEEGEVEDDLNLYEIGNEEVDIDNNSVQVLDSERITKPVLTKYEIPRILGIRVQQLIKGAPPLVKNSVGKPPIQIALDELLTKRIPFKIKRPMPYSKHEIWKLNELDVNISQDDIDDLIACINV